MPQGLFNQIVAKMMYVSQTKKAGTQSAFTVQEIPEVWDKVIRDRKPSSINMWKVWTDQEELKDQK